MVGWNTYNYMSYEAFAKDCCGMGGGVLLDNGIRYRGMCS